MYYVGRLQGILATWLNNAMWCCYKPISWARVVLRNSFDDNTIDVGLRTLSSCYRKISELAKRELQYLNYSSSIHITNMSPPKFVVDQVTLNWFRRLSGIEEKPTGQINFKVRSRLMFWSHQPCRPVLAVRLLEGIMLRNSCWPTIFHTITIGDVNKGVPQMTGVNSS